MIYRYAKNEESEPQEVTQPVEPDEAMIGGFHICAKHNTQVINGGNCLACERDKAVAELCEAAVHILDDFKDREGCDCISCKHKRDLRSAIAAVKGLL